MNSYSKNQARSNMWNHKLTNANAQDTFELEEQITMQKDK